MDKGNRISCVVWLVISVFVGITSVRLGIGTLRNPGSGFILFGTSILLAIAAAVLFGTGFLKKYRAARPADVWKGRNWGKNIIVIAALIAYCLTLRMLGYVFATFGLMLVMFSLGKMKPWAIILSALVTVLFSYCLFGYFLKTPLPRGILGF